MIKNQVDHLADIIIASNPGPVADYKNGKLQAINFLKGRLVVLGGGRFAPSLAGDILLKKLTE